MLRQSWKKIIGICELLSALPMWGLYLGWYTRWGIPTDDPWLWAGIDLVGILFLLLPLFGTYGAFRNKGWAIYPLAAFPIIAFVFGLGAVPLVAYLAPVGSLRTILLGFINSGVIFSLFYFNRVSGESDA